MANTFWSRIVLLALVIAAGLSAAPVHAQNIAVQRTVWSDGDDLAWASPSLDDATWSQISSFTGAPPQIFWIREDIVVQNTAPKDSGYVLSVEGTGAFEVFFDGHLLGGSGALPLAGASERPGATRFELGVPAEFLTSGEHVIAFRISASGLRAKDPFFVKYEVKSSNETLAQNSLSLLSLGGACAAVLILMFLFAAGSFGSGSRSSFLAAIGIAAGILVIVLVEALERSGAIAYPWRETANVAAMAAAVCVSISLPAFLLARFDSSRAKIWMAGLAAVFLVSIPSWPGLAIEHDARAFFLLCLYCLGICWAAFRRGKPQALLFAICFCVLIAGVAIDPASLYLFLVLLSVFLSISLADHLRQQQVLAKQAEVTAARLEVEMLRRNIQPHFLMNSLTAITEWIETAPVEALRFIDGLAEEFRSLMKLSSRTSVPLSDEIELCQVHLDLMGMRQRKTFTLDVDGVDLATTIPPGIIHTLLENALSHNRYLDTQIAFMLREKCERGGRTLIFSGPIGERTQHNLQSTGAGLQYVRSRLEESFPGKWKFTSEQEGDAWVSRIFIPIA